MRTIGITGHLGLIGTHLRAYFFGRPDLQVIGADVQEFSDQDSLRRFAASCDVIVHLAGLNRGEETEVYEGNIRLTDALISAVESAGTRPHIFFSSSNHIYRGTRYGDSKRVCSEHLTAFSKRSGARFTNLILPNVFGEGGRPFYNSVVSTFCHQLATGLEPVVKVDMTMELLHAQDVALLIDELMTGGRIGDVEPPGRPSTVVSLLEKLRQIDTGYRAHVIPDLRDPFDLALFNTYRSYLFPQHYPVALALHSDARGWLFEGVKALQGGQVFVSNTRPGITRGNHFHLRKVERFLVVSGEAEIRVRHMFSDQVTVLSVSGGRPAYVDIPTLHTHNLRNTGNTELVTLFWAHEIFDPSRPDTVAQPV